MAQRSRDSAPAKWMAGVLVGVLAIAVAVLAWMAYRHVNPTESPTPAPSASTALGEITPTPTPTATPTPTPTVEPVDLAAQRYLVVTGESSVWRAVAGSCSSDAAALVERSADNGATFTDVTPNYLGIRQVASLDPFDTAQAEMVAGMGEDCAPEALRTFTGGDFWESYDDVLAASTYVDPNDPARVVTPDGAIDAPCGQAWGLRSDGGTVALICEGAAYTLDGDTWSQLSHDGTAAALAVDGGTVYVAAEGAPDCGGLAVLRDGSPVLCAAEASAPAALDVNGGQGMLWAGDTLVSVEG